jgi:hypothetical protein
MMFIRNCRRQAIFALLLSFALTSHAVEPDPEGWIAFEGQGGGINFSGTVNGELARITLDSGASIGAVGRDFGERVGIEADPRRPIQVAGVFDETRVYGCRPFELVMNDQTLHLADLAVVPGAGFDIMLGRWIFEQVVVQIDYPNQRIRFLSREAVQFESNVEVRETPFGSMLIETFIQDQRAWLELDTGNLGPVFLNERFVQRHDFQDFEVPLEGLQSQGVIRSGEIRVLQFDSARIGPYSFASLLASYGVDSSRGIFRQESETGSRVRRARTRRDGLLGAEVLQNFLVTTDFRNRKIHLHLQ